MQRICRSSASRKKRGFTLIEIVVVAPLVLLLIGAAVAVTINASTSALRANAKAQLQNDILIALDMIEQDVMMSVRIEAASPSQLVIDGFATTKNPLDLTRQLIKMPGCTPAAAGIFRDEALKFTRTYYISGNTLSRQTTLTGGACSNAWQKAAEEQLIKDATLTLNVAYEGVSGGDARTVHVTLTGVRTVGGQDVSYTGKMYVTSANL